MSAIYIGIGDEITIAWRKTGTHHIVVDNEKKKKHCLRDLDEYYNNMIGGHVEYYFFVIRYKPYYAN